MKAAYLTGPERIEVREEQTPEVEPGRILVRVRAVGVCGSDVHYYEHGRMGPFVPSGPLVLGHESAGEVAAVGDGVVGPAVGDRVALEPGVPCLRCRECKAGRYNLCGDVYFMGSAPDQHGAFREYLLWDPSFAYRLPEEVSYEEGALVEPLAAAVYAVRRAQVRPGSTAAVLGCGPVGLLIVQAALAAGAAVLYAADPDERRREAARRFGAKRVIDPAAEDPAAVVLEELGGADSVFEAAGTPATYRQALEAAARGGSVVLVGWTPEAEVALDVHLVGVKELTVLGMFRYRNVYPEALALVARGAIRLAELVTHRYPLDRVEDAIQFARERRAGTLKIIVEASGE